MAEADEDELLYDDVDDDEVVAAPDPAPTEAPAPAAPAEPAATPGTDAAPSDAPAPASEDPATNPAGPVDPNQPTGVYVSGLTWWTTDVDVETYCGEYGKVKSTTFFAEKSNGKSKGTACVEFEEPAAARLCVEKLPYKRIHGRDLTVKFAPVTKVGSDGKGGSPAGKVPDTAWKGPVPQQGFGGMNQFQQQQMMQRQYQQMMMMQQQMMAKGGMGAMGAMGGMGGMGGWVNGRDGGHGKGHGHGHEHDGRHGRHGRWRRSSRREKAASKLEEL